MRTRQLVRDLIRKTPNPERRYINDRGTLITLAVKSHHDSLRDERVGRAGGNVRTRELDIESHEVRLSEIPSGILFAREANTLRRWLREDKVLLTAAQSELKTAKRIVAKHNKRGEMCVVHVSPVKMPRSWPNAVPGGTSHRRACHVLIHGKR